MCILLPLRLHFKPAVCIHAPMLLATAVGQALIVQLKEDVAGLKEAHQVVEEQNVSQVAQLREENEASQAQAEQVEVLMARCARLEVSTAKQRQGGPIDRRRLPFGNAITALDTRGSI